MGMEAYLRIKAIKDLRISAIWKSYVDDLVESSIMEATK